MHRTVYMTKGIRRCLYRYIQVTKVSENSQIKDMEIELEIVLIVLQHLSKSSLESDSLL